MGLVCEHQFLWSGRTRKCQELNEIQSTVKVTWWIQLWLNSYYSYFPNNFPMTSPHISAEALTSLQAEARKFLSVAGDHVECGPKFHLEFGIEIDKSCQKVLADTYGTCVFPNVLDFNPDQKRHYCTTHKKKCRVIKNLKKNNKSKRSSTKQCMFFLNYID